MVDSNRSSFQIQAPARVKDALARAAKAEGVTVTKMAGRWLELSLEGPPPSGEDKGRMMARLTTVRVWPSSAVREALEKYAKRNNRTLSMECRLRLEDIAKTSPAEITPLFMHDLKDILQKHGLVSADGKVMW